MIRRFAVLAVLVLGASLAAFFGGCGSGDIGGGSDTPDAASPSPDAAHPDASSAVTADGASEAASDATSALTDSGSDATIDSGSDATIDSGSDAPSDAQPADAPIDSPVDAADANVRCADGGAPPCVIVLASGQHAPVGIAVDSTSVYWTTYGSVADDGGAVMRTRIGGGAITTIASGQARPAELAVDTSTLYWTLLSGNAVMEATLDGGPPKPFASSPASAQGIAVDGTNVYWAALASVFQAPKQGASPVTLLASGVGNPQGPFLHGTDVYFTDFNNGLVEKMPIGGGGRDAGSPIVVASGQKHPGFIAFDSAHLYWYNGGDSAAVTNGSIMMLPLDDTDGGLPVPLATNRAFGEEILLDGQTLYWAEGSAIERLTLPTGTPTTFLATGAPISFMAQDATNLYWTSPAAGTVNQVAK